MNLYGLDSEVVDPASVARTAQRFREQQIVLPTFAQLTDPSTAPGALREQLAGIDKDAASPANLGDVHWYNTTGGGVADVPSTSCCRELTGVDAQIVVAFGNRFPMIGAHKVLAAYACLAPRLVTGQFDPTRTGRSGHRRATTAAAASPSRASWAAAGSPCCPRR